jgi:ABC-type multidrug transport system ATPase subunit
VSAIVILSTHIVSDVEATATHIALINKGRLIVSAAPEVLMKKVEAPRVGMDRAEQRVDRRQITPPRERHHPPQ